MTKKLYAFAVVALLLLPISAFAQEGVAEGTAFQFDLRGVGGLYSHTPSDPNLDWTFIGGTIPPPTVEEESDVIAMDFDSTATLYGVDVFLNILGTINTANGDFTTVAALSGAIPPNVQAMTIDSLDVAWVSDGTGLWMMDISTGVCVQVATQFTNTVGGAAVGTVFELAVDGAGNFFCFDITLDTLWSLDETNGNVTALGVFPGPGNPNFSNNGMDFDPDTGILYGDVYTGGGTGVYGTWNTTTGAFSAILSHASYPLGDPRVGGPIANFGGTCYQMDFYLDRWLTFDIGDPTSNLTEAPQPAGTALFAMDFNETGTLYAVDTGGNQVGTIDTTTGVFTPTVPLSGDYNPFAGAVGMTCDPSTGQFYLANTTSFYTLDVTTGVTTFVADFTGEPLNNAPDTVIEIACDNSGDMYIFTIGDDGLYRVNKTTGVSTFLGFAPVNASFIQGMDVDPENDTLYGSIYVSGGTGLYGTWNKTTGVFTTIIELENIVPPDADGYELKLAIKPASTGPVVVTPTSIVTTRGEYVAGGIPEISSSDNADYQQRRLSGDIQSRTEFEVKAISPVASPTSFEVTLEGAVFARSNVVQSIELFDYDLGVWELVDSQNANRSPNPDKTVTIAATGDLSRFVETGTNCIEARVRYRSDSPRQNFASNTDMFIWTIQ